MKSGCRACFSVQRRRGKSLKYLFPTQLLLNPPSSLSPPSPLCIHIHNIRSPPRQTSMVSMACCHRSTDMPPHPTAPLVHAGGKTTKRDAAKAMPTRRMGTREEEAAEGARGRKGGGGGAAPGGEEEEELAMRAAAFLLWTPMSPRRRRCFLCCARVDVCERAGVVWVGGRSDA